MLLAIAGLFVGALLRDPQLHGSWRLWAALLLGAAFAGGLYVAGRKPSLFAIAALGALSTAITAMAPHSAAGLMYAVIAVAALRLPLATGLLVAAATTAASMGVQYLLIGLSAFNGLPLEALAVTLTFVGLYSVRRRRAEEERTRELEREAARAEERARLAREIHDVLAHSLSAMAVQLDLAEVLMKQRPEDPAALQAVARAHALAREGLQDVRRAVSALRGEQLPGPELLRQLAADFEGDTGVVCRLELPEALPALSPEERVALYRTAQEALTNVRKHAVARQVALRLRTVDGGVELSVVDDGQARPDGQGGGFGLTGMRERAELLGGRLEAGPLSGAGFKVRLWLPTP